MSVKKTKPAKAKISAEFKLLLATSAVTKTAVTKPGEQEGDDPVEGIVHGHGRPTPPTIVTFKDRDTADIAHDSIIAFNYMSQDVAVHVVKLYT